MQNNMPIFFRVRALTAFAALLLAVVVASPALAAETRVLPAPEKTGGKPLMQVLAERHSTRTFRNKPVEPQTLSNLLWAAFGVNRGDGRRTVPTALNEQKVALYVALDSGVWRYDGKTHVLVRELDKDIRPQVGNAPAVLIYAAPSNPWGAMHIGSMYQNVGLFCASEGLANVVKGQHVNALKDMLKLPSTYEVQITQSVGWQK